MIQILDSHRKFRRWAGRGLMRGLRPLLPKGRHLALRYFVETTLYGWEREVRSLRQFVRGGGVAVDVGANWGLWTYGLARSGLFDRVVAIEPNPSLLSELTAASLPGVELRMEAASNAFEELELKVPVRAGQVLEGWATVEAAPEVEADEIRRLRVSSRTLDSLQLSGVGFIKIDVEGHELAVLEGARETIMNSLPDCLVECKATNLAHADLFFQGLDAGYQRVTAMQDRGMEFSTDNHFFYSSVARGVDASR